MGWSWASLGSAPHSSAAFLKPRALCLNPFLDGRLASDRQNCQRFGYLGTYIHMCVYTEQSMQPSVKRKEVPGSSHTLP